MTAVLVHALAAAIPPRFGEAHTLTTGRHSARAEALGRLGVPLRPEGLVLGRDRNGEPVVVRVFSDEVRDSVLVGGWWAALLIAFRAVALGCRVVVNTTSPHQWHGLGRAAGQESDVTVLGAADAASTWDDGASRRVLWIVDTGAAGGRTEAPTTRGHTRLTLLPQLSPLVVDLLPTVHLVILQRLDPHEVAVMRSVWRMSGATPDLLQQMNDDMLAIVGGHADRYLWVNPTSIEERILGAPHR
jgi:hypothetical protein